MNDIEMEYVQFGDGEKTMIMMPGIGLTKIVGSADAIEAAYGPYTKDYTVYVFDRPNTLKKGTTIEEIADDFITVFKALELKDIYLFGVSYGGMLSQHIAIKAPELVKKLCLTSTDSKVSEGAYEYLNKWKVNCSTETIEELTVDMLNRIYTPELIAANRDNLITFFKGTSKKELNHFLIQLESAMHHNTYDNLDKITCPTLVVCSKNDKVFSYNDYEMLINRLNCDSYSYAKASHALYDEEATFKGILFNFFNRVD